MKKYIKIIGITFIICLVLIGLKSEYSKLLLQNASYGMPALIEKGEIENLFIGSSMFRQGLDIDTLCRMLGEDTYILAYNGNQPVEEYLELEYLLSQGVQIKNLYIDMYAYSASARPDISDEKLFLEVGMKEKGELWKLTRKGYLKEDAESLWRIFVNGNNELLLTWPISEKLINKQFKKGGSLIQTNSASKEQLESWQEPYGIELNSEQAKAIKGIVLLSERQDIHIAFLETPKYERIAKSEKYLHLMKEYCELLKKENVDIILDNNTKESIETNGNYRGYSFNNWQEKFFIDGIHLSTEGRKEFSGLVLK